MNGRFGTVFKILHFAVKKQMTVWVQLQNFVSRCKKTNARFSTRILTVLNT